MLDDCLDGSVADAHVAVCRHVGTGHLGIVEAGGHVHVADATENAGAYIDVGRTGHQAGTTAVAAVAAVATGTAVAGRRHGIAGSTAAGPATATSTVAAIAGHSAGITTTTTSPGRRGSSSTAVAAACSCAITTGTTGSSSVRTGIGGCILRTTRGQEATITGVIIVSC